jgi:hypothetical protein
MKGGSSAPTVLLSSVLTLALGACGTTLAAASSTRPPAAVQSVAAGPATWTRPLDVKPIGLASVFKVVSQTPSPGDKVPIFFMGAQY